MALRERLIPWTEQPQEATGVDWGNPLSSGLIYAVNAASPGPEQARNSVPSLAGTLTSSPHGIVRSQTGASKAFAFADEPASRPAEVTLFARLRRTGSVGANTSAVGKNFQSNGSPSFVSFSITYNASGSGQNSIQAAQGIAGAFSPGTNYTHPDTTAWHDVALVKPAGSLLLYTDGMLRATNSVGAIAYGSSGENNFGTNIGGATAPFDYALILLWGRALTAQEIASVGANPWQLFQPRRIFVPQAGITGLPTLSAATYVPGSLTASGFRPRVTAQY